MQVAAGSSHTVLLTGSGQVYTFGSHKVSLSQSLLMKKEDINNVAVVLLYQIMFRFLTFSFEIIQKNQLGRQEDGQNDKWGAWYTRPGLVPGIGKLYSCGAISL